MSEGGEETKPTPQKKKDIPTGRMPGCLSFSRGRNGPAANLVITSAFSETVGGRAECLLSAMNPSVVEWTNAEGEAATLRLSPDRMTAYDVPVGEYELRLIEDGTALCIPFVVDYAMDMPFVSSYSVSHASTDGARDGKVVADVRNAPDDCLFLWTGGAMTETPSLHDVRPGTYSVCLLTRSRETVVFVHACHPAVVSVEEGDDRV